MRTLYHFYLWAADRINDAGPLMMHEWSRPGGHYRLSLAPFPSSPGRLTVEGAGGGWGSVQERFMWENKRDPGSVVIPNRKLLFQEYNDQLFYKQKTTTKWSCYSYNLNNFLFKQSPILIGPLLIPCIFVKPVTCSLGLLIFVLLDLKHVSKRKSPREYIFLEKISCLSERYPVLLHWLFIWLCMSAIFN